MILFLFGVFLGMTIMSVLSANDDKRTDDLEQIKFIKNYQERKSK